MKKHFVLTLCFVALCGIMHAASITFVNMTPNPIFFYQLQGKNTTSSPSGEWLLGDVVIPALTTVGYANPTLMPGMPSSALPSGFFTSVYADCNPTYIGVGSTMFTSLPQQQTVVAGSNCNGGITFDVSWNQSVTAPYNVTVLIW
jgi:hypothetical protein